jgi:hypothetical protein
MSARQIESLSDEVEIPFAETSSYVSSWDRRINDYPKGERRGPTPTERKREAIEISDRISDAARRRSEINAAFKESWNIRQQQGEVITNNLVWAKSGAGFFALPSDYELIPESTGLGDAVNAFSSLGKYLDHHGVDLKIQVIPDPYAVAARVLNPDYAKHIDVDSATLVKDLLSVGIDADYVTDTLVARARDYDLTFCFPEDRHPAHGCQDVLTDLSSEAVTEYQLDADLEKGRFTIDHGVSYRPTLFPATSRVAVEYSGRPMLTDNYLYDGVVLATDRASPVMVIGNSYIQTPMNHRNSYASLLASKTLVRPYVFSYTSYGVATRLIPELLTHGERHLKGRRICILPISAQHLRTQPWVDLAELDGMLRLLSDREQVHQFELDVAKRNKGHVVFSGTIPVALRSSELIVVVKVAMLGKQKGHVIVNGQERGLFSVNVTPRRRIIATAIPAGTKSIRVEVVSDEPPYTVALDAISILK